MTQLWSSDPLQRPSAEQVLTLCKTSHFCHMVDVVSIDDTVEVSCIVPIVISADELIVAEGKNAFRHICSGSSQNLYPNIYRRATA